MGLRFTKMHGAGNDIVIVDRRADRVPLDNDLALLLGDRRRGVGCDQIMLIEPARSRDAVAGYRILNADGSEARQCGNGARCVVAWLVRRQLARAGEFTLDGPSGPVRAFVDEAGTVSVELDVPEFRPERVPFRASEDTDPQRIEVEGAQVDIGVVSIGNPHAVIAVDDVDRAPVTRLGPAIEHHPAFPDRVNVGFVQVVDRSRLRLRVHERGVGETLACGSGACAAVAILARRGRVEQSVAVDLPGGTLRVDWDGTGPIRLSGPTTFVFEGTLLT